MPSSTSSDPYGPSPSRKEVKQTRREWVSEILCLKCCAKEGIKRCSKCKTALYCSPECQKEDWPDHKERCSLYTKGGVDMKKLCHFLMANMLLRRYIEVLVILKLGLLEKRKAAEPFQAQIIIGFEPVDILDFFTLFNPSAVIYENPLQGMLQLHHLPERTYIRGLSEQGAIPISELEKCREVNKFVGLEALPVGFIQFVHGSGEKISIVSIELNVQQESLELARQANQLDIIIDFDSGKTVKKPLSESTCTEHINTLIRQDTENQWLLRMNMEKRHKEMINEAGVIFFRSNSDSVRTPAASTAATISDGFTKSIGLKVQQESIYSHQLEVFKTSHRS